MDSIFNLLIEWGLPGMFITAFLAGSFIPFSSEVVMAGLIAAGIPSFELFICASIGNILGGMFNYCVGRQGNEAWIHKYLRLPPKKLNKGIEQVKRYGHWAGLLSWIPIFGSVTTIAMGYLRLNAFHSFLSIAAGKTIRYYIWMECMIAVEQIG